MVCNQIKGLQEGCQVRLAGSASMDGFVSQLALLARGWGGRVVRSKRGFGAAWGLFGNEFAVFVKEMYVFG